jgi:hypothetical protein
MTKLNCEDEFKAQLLNSDPCPNQPLDFLSETSAAIAQLPPRPTLARFIKYWKKKILPTHMARILKVYFVVVEDHMIQKRSEKR